VAFTNLSHDHLDYHGTMEEYFAAKSLLFTPTYGSRAVIWVDDPYGAQLAASTTIPVTTVARNNAEQLTQSLHGTHFVWRGHAVTTPLIGDYNVDNVLVAMSIVSALGADDAAIAAAMTHVSPVPGRFEVVSSDGPVVIVDYAHTPDGLERLLRAIRQLHTGRIITVVGCGGDRDRAKRPVMGRVGADLSDVCIVTSDNPRHEDPEQIIDEIVAELSPDRYVRVVDRRAAIAQAIGVAQPSDVVLIAGKGHEVTQTIGDLVLPFDDRAVAREMLVH
jgi:UDP-N-acetylmuramoyl-L-alanyl-D-glutamate--2,6-diaminopimelate ligase